MCNFSRGECIAIGTRKALSRLRERERDLPGFLEIAPLVDHDEGPEAFADIDTATLYVEAGDEIHGIARIASILGDALENGQAAVDLNYYMDFSAPRAKRVAPPFSDFTTEWLAAQRIAIDARLAGPSPRFLSHPPSIAVLDSGVDRRRLANRRPVELFDYVDGASGTRRPPTADLNGHGTRVVSILDALLPSQIPISVGRVADNDAEVTVLSVSRAYADLVSRVRPIVVNLSLHPSDDSPFGTFLPFVFRLAESTTATIMAAGNNSDHYSGFSGVAPLRATVLAAAIGSTGRPTKYTNRPRGAAANDLTAWTFGGDDPDFKNGHGFFAEREGSGTSYAAPVLTASWYAVFVGSGSLTFEEFFNVHMPPRLSAWVDGALRKPRRSRRVVVEDDD